MPNTMVRSTPQFLESPGGGFGVELQGGKVALVTATTDVTGGVRIISKLTQAQYDAIVTKDDSTLYVIVG